MPPRRFRAGENYERTVHPGTTVLAHEQPTADEGTQMSVQGNAVAIAIALAGLLLLGGCFYAAAGIGTPRAESSYTGVVADIEEDKGFVFQTTQVHVRTDERSSSTETFCVHPEDQDEILPTLYEAQETQQRITVEYARDRYVPVWDCERDLSQVESVTLHNETG